MVGFKIILALLGIGLLSACSTTSIPQVVCPEVSQYTDETQKKAAEELQELREQNKAPIVRQFIVDYGALRARLRAVNCK
jgi:hypothetical protein